MEELQIESLEFFKDIPNKSYRMYVFANYIEDSIPENLRENKSIILSPLENIISSDLIKSMPELGLNSIIEIYLKLLELNGPEEFMNYFNFYFKPQIANKEDTTYYTILHSAIYEERASEITNEIIEGNRNVFVTTSGMFAGKTTLCLKILDRLEENGYRTLVAVGLPTKHIKARGGKEVVADPLFTFKDLDSIFQKLLALKAESVNVALYFDEFTFTDKRFFFRLEEFCRKQNITLIASGLSHSATNVELAPATTAKGITQVDESCRAFVRGLQLDDNIMESMLGDRSMRFICLPNGQFLPDFGFGPKIVVDQDGREGFYYYPTPDKMHPAVFLNNSETVREVQNLSDENEQKSFYTLLKNTTINLSGAEI